MRYRYVYPTTTITKPQLSNVNNLTIPGLTPGIEYWGIESPVVRGESNFYTTLYPPPHDIKYFNRDSFFLEDTLLTLRDANDVNDREVRNALSVPNSSLKLNFSIKNLKNVNSIPKIDTNYPFVAGFIIPLKLNNEFNPTHTYKTDYIYDEITREQTRITKKIFPTSDFKATFTSSKDIRLGPENITTTKLNSINNFPFINSLQANSSNTLDFGLINATNLNSFNTSIKSIINSVNYVDTSVTPSTNNRQVIYVKNMIFPNSDKVNIKLRNKSISGILILLNQTDIDILKANNIDYPIQGVNNIFPIKYSLLFDFYNIMGITKFYNEITNSELFNMDFRWPDNSTLTSSNMFFYAESLNSEVRFNVVDFGAITSTQNTYPTPKI